VRPYEVMVIFDVGAEPPAIQGVIDRTLETIRASGGTPGTVDRWGRRPFAYEVRHRSEGYYVVIELSGEPRTVADLDRLLSLSDEVLRHKVVRLPDKAVRVAARNGAERGGPASEPSGRSGVGRGRTARGETREAPARRSGARRTTREQE
jgi:small subunit ribosomal protein S6